MGIEQREKKGRKTRWEGRMERREGGRERRKKGGKEEKQTEREEDRHAGSRTVVKETESRKHSPSH